MLGCGGDECGIISQVICIVSIFPSLGDEVDACSQQFDKLVCGSVFIT